MEEEKKVYIGNLEYNLTEEELQKWFEEKGFEVKEVKIVRDKFTGRSKGFGFAEVETDEQVQKLIDSLNGQELKSRNIRVNRARKRQPRFEEGD